MAREKCVHTDSETGKRCGSWPIKGATVCYQHGGAAGHVRANAAIRVEVSKWTLGDVHVDPGEVLLRLVSQSSQRCELYAGLLQQAYDAAERLSQAEDETVWGLLKSDKEARSAQADQARDDLDRIFNGGGVAALVGNTYGAAKDVGVYRTGEAIRGLAELEAKERERCAGFAAKAVAAGLHTRMVELAEQQGALIVKLLRGVLDDPDLELTEGQKQVAQLAMAREMRALSAA